LSSTMLAQTAYAATAPVRTSRGTEYAAFQKVTARMIRATRDGASMAERAIALQENRRLWTVLATDLADEANGLPDILRARLLFLAEFTLLNGSRALKDAGAMQPLIDINSAVMRGLSGDGGPE
jgi:flagellar protein FlaF